MIDPIIPRLAHPSEAKQIQEWMHRTKGNLYDPKIWSYPTLITLAAEKAGKVLAYLPSQQALVMESLATGEGVSNFEINRAFTDLVKANCLIASTKGIREIYFLCEDETVIGLAKFQGFEILPFKCLRLKLSGGEVASNDQTDTIP